MGKLNWISGNTGMMHVGAVELEYATHGPAPSSKPTIVMLHEGLGSVSAWKDFPQKLADETGHGIFVYSRSGYGNSSPCDLPRPLDYMTREAVDVLPELLDQIGAQSYILLGHSDGASIAAIYAGSVEDFRVRGLVLMAPHFFTEPLGLESIRQAKAAFDSGDLKDRLSRHHKQVENAFRGWNDAWLDPDFENWDITEVIDYWRIPVLGIQGENDEYGTLDQVRIMSERSYAPVDECVISGCGHSPHRDKPDEVITATSEFVHRLTRIEAETVRIA